MVGPPGSVAGRLRTGSVVAAGLSGDYWRFWWASTLSNLGDGLRIVALPLLAVSLTRDPLLISGVTAVTFLPWLLIGPISGAIVDRVDRRKLLIGVQLARGTVAAGFTLTVATGTVTIVLLYLTAAAIAVGETLADAAAQAAVPQLAAADRLEVANGHLVTGQIATNEIIGAPLGAALFAVSASAPFLLDSVTYLAAALLVWLVATELRPRPELEASGSALPRLRTDVIEGIRYVFSHQLLRPLAISAGIANFGAAATGAVLVLFVIETLQLSEFGFGILLGIAAAGGLLGASIAGQIVARIHRRTAMVASLAVSACTMLILGMTGNPIVAGAMLFATSASGSAYNVVARSLRQAIPPARLLGRTITSARLVGLGAAPIGAIVGGALARTAGLRAPFYLAAAVLTVTMLLLHRTLQADRIDHAIAANRNLTAATSRPRLQGSNQPRPTTTSTSDQTQV